MEQGRELDAFIAEKIMGIIVKNIWPNGTMQGNEMDGWKPIPRYSSDIAAAFEVVQKIKSIETRDGKETSHFFTLEFDQSDLKWTVGWQYIYCDYSTNWIIEASADTAPLAICLAAMKTIGVES